MTKIHLQSGKIIKPQEFHGGNPERQLQGYVEKYLNLFFQCHFLKSLYNIPGGEIDTLAITEDGVPCIIEYKHKKEDRILNQIIFYYDWLMQRPTRFEFERIAKEKETTKKLNIDWSKIRLICVAKEYSSWDASLIKHIDTDIECWTYDYHEDELDIHLDPIINQFKKTRSYSGRPTTKEISLEEHRNKAGRECKILLDELRDKVFGLGDDIIEGYAPNYIKYLVKTNFLEVHVRKNWLIIYLKVDEKSFNDPQKLSKNVSSRGWSLTREAKIKNQKELVEVFGLIEQAYSAQH